MAKNIFKEKPIKRFSPIRILAICGLQGLVFVSIEIILCGIFGLLKGIVLPISSITKIAGVGFISGFLFGFTKI